MDLIHIESKVTEMIKHDRSLTLLHGELIERWMSIYMYSCNEGENECVLVRPDVVESEGAHYHTCR